MDVALVAILCSNVSISTAWLALVVSKAEILEAFDVTRSDNTLTFATSLIILWCS
jgi:hypothetical protein